jgi:hypothetical protein
VIVAAALCDLLHERGGVDVGEHLEGKAPRGLVVSLEVAEGREEVVRRCGVMVG